MTKKQMMPTQSSQSTNQSNALHTLKSSFGLGKAVKMISYPVLAIGAVASANAGIIVVDGNVEIDRELLTNNGGANNGTIDWDIDGDSTIDFSFSDGELGCQPGTGSLCLTSSGVGAGFANVSGTSNLVSVSGATTIDSNNEFRHLTCDDFYDVDCDHTSHGGLCGGSGDAFSLFNEADNFNGIFGFQFDNGGTTNYGVASFEVTSWDGDASNGLGNFKITQWAYNDDGGAISGSALPDVQVSEPATIGIMLLGMGAMGLRRRRQAMKLAS